MPNSSLRLQTCTIPDTTGYAYRVEYEKGGRHIKDPSDRCLSLEEWKRAKEMKNIEGGGCPDDSWGRFDTQMEEGGKGILVLRCAPKFSPLRFRMESGVSVFITEQSQPPLVLDDGGKVQVAVPSKKWKVAGASYVALGLDYRVHPFISFFGEVLTGYYSVPENRKDYFQLGVAGGAAFSKKGLPLSLELGLKTVGLIPTVVPAESGWAIGGFLSLGLPLNDLVSIKLNVPLAEAGKVGDQNFQMSPAGAGFGIQGIF